MDAVNIGIRVARITAKLIRGTFTTGLLDFGWWAFVLV